LGYDTSSTRSRWMPVIADLCSTLLLVDLLFPVRTDIPMQS
jgi:hypothetical protein